MEIEIGQKWVNILYLYLTSSNEYKIYEFNIGDIINITSIDYKQQYPYYTDISLVTKQNLPLTKKEILDHFITLAEWRERQINIILDGN